jgi:hypothetical protein
MWNVWWTDWHCDRFITSSSAFPCQLHFTNVPYSSSIRRTSGRSLRTVTYFRNWWALEKIRAVLYFSQGLNVSVAPLPTFGPLAYISVHFKTTIHGATPPDLLTLCFKPNALLLSLGPPWWRSQLVQTYRNTTPYHNPQDYIMNMYRCENLK